MTRRLMFAAALAVLFVGGISTGAGGSPTSISRVCSSVTRTVTSTVTSISTVISTVMQTVTVTSSTTTTATTTTTPTTTTTTTPTTTQTPPAPAPSGSIYWGAYIEGTQTYGYLYGGTWSNGPWCDPGTQCPLPKFTSNAGKAPSVEHWGMCWTCTFDSGVAALVVGRGDIPAVDWANDSSASDADIAAGKYDSYITSQAQAMKSFAHPLFLLWDEEMNGSWYPYSPGQNGNTAASFVAAWRHIHDIFAAVGATNVTWVWCPNVDPDNSMTPLSQLYPGDAYVDWTGLNGYNWGGSSWMSFAQVFTTSYNALLQVAPTKPILIGETASGEDGGSKAGWITDALSTQLPQNFPQIKALLWENWRIYEKGAWWPWEIESSSSSQQAFATGISSSYYASGGSFGNLPLLRPVAPLP
jgi:Glycosyl hydrolase family 26